MDKIEDSPELAEYKANQEHWLAHNQAQLLLQLLAANVARIRADFSGQGDSGCVDGISYYDAADKLIDAEFEATKLDAGLRDKVGKLIDARLEDTGWDWSNNDGGGGALTIDVKTGTCEVTGYYYVQETYDADPESGWKNTPSDR